MIPATSPRTASSAMPNELLAALPDDERMRVAPHMGSLVLKPGEVLYETDRTQSWVYFPCGAIVSLLYVTKNGDSMETAMVGNEGMIGVHTLLSDSAPLDCAVVQSGGAVLRVRVDEVRKEFARGGIMQHVLLRYTQALMTQMEQTAVCNRYHTVDRQLCRWLLMALDRLPSSELVMTQEMIADLLGVRRAGVAAAASALQRAGAIEYKRGRIEVIDRPRLESLTCDCYKAIREKFAHLLPWSALSIFGGYTAVAKRPPDTWACEERRHVHAEGSK